MSFNELGFSENILKAIADCGYSQPTPIQAQAIPHVLMGRDLVGLAQTGTGKTASFTLPMIEILAGGRAKARMPRSLVLVPTRELAAQVAENFDTYGKYSKLTKALLVGGVSMEEQIKLLDRGVDVLIATPGRMLDLFERGKILLTDIKILVIDEADRMMDMGFIPDIEKIVSLLPPIRQTLLFSATMPPEIRKLTQKFLSNPREVSVAAVSSTAEKVEQFLVWTDRRRKREALDTIIRQENVQNAFIFCNRKRDIGDLTQFLTSKRYAVKALHGDLVQSVRTKTLDEFKSGQVTLLVCSDVAARGLDVDDVSHVFNYDVPFNAEDYVHRIGRTGRAGKAGRAWSLASKGDDEKLVDAIQRLIKKQIPVQTIGGGRSEQGEGRREEKREPRSEGRRDHQKKSEAGEPSRRDERPQREERPLRRPAYGDENNNKNSNSGRESQIESEDGNQRGFGEDVPGLFGKN
jgi:superfamily II DNA/RNA helicase